MKLTIPDFNVTFLDSCQPSTDLDLYKVRITVDIKWKQIMKKETASNHSRKGDLTIFQSQRSKISSTDMKTKRFNYASQFAL